MMMMMTDDRGVARARRQRVFLVSIVKADLDLPETC